MGDYPAFQKIPRWFRDITITEKIDGTNGLIYITETPVFGIPAFGAGHSDLLVYAGSRNRWLTLGSDNYTFAAWVNANAEALANILGPGHHYGEWWGSGIQRKYGLTGTDKRFSLFNTHKWEGLEETDPMHGLHVVPILYKGLPVEESIENVLNILKQVGSYAAPGFMKPEGICIYHSASGRTYKVTLENDSEPKGATRGRLAA